MRLNPENERAQQLKGAHCVRAHRKRIVGVNRIAGKTGARRKVGGPTHPAIPRPIGDSNVRVRQKCVAPIIEAPFSVVVVEFVIALAQQAKGVVIRAKPHMEPVLFYSTGRTSS